MRDVLRERLNTEVTRQQFLQYMGTALLMVFGLNNLIQLLSTTRSVKYPQQPAVPAPNASDGFGTRRFGK
jgi:hypothetical protein